MFLRNALIYPKGAPKYSAAHLLSPYPHADSDDLRDLRSLLDEVKNSSVVVVMQSKELLRRPWCLLELYTAVVEGIPIVALNCIGKGYDYAAATEFLTHLESKLATLSPGAAQTLLQNGVDPIHAAHKLSSVLPNIISVPLNTFSSDNAIKASLIDLSSAIMRAEALPVERGFETWLAQREQADLAGVDAAVESGTIRGTQKGRVLVQAERASSLEKELVELRAASEAKDAAFAKERSSLREEIAAVRAEMAEERRRHNLLVAKKDARLEKLEDKLFG